MNPEEEDCWFEDEVLFVEEVWEGLLEDDSLCDEVCLDAAFDVPLTRWIAMSLSIPGNIRIFRKSNCFSQS